MQLRNYLSTHHWVLITCSILSIIFTLFFFKQDMLLLYGDAESHLNISKRVTSSITPGLAQLGGIWLPLPHLLMLPFTSIDYLWNTGLAGSIVSGFSYVISAVVIYKIILLLTGKKIGALIGASVFALNPNIAYLQSTAMTELPLIMFFLLSTLFFFHYLKDTSDPLNLVYAAFWGLCASLTRYDGWFLVIAQAGVVVVNHLFTHKTTRDLVGKFILFSTLGLCGIGAWLLWNSIILKDPLYFTNSPFSAKSQQQGWLARGELPAYHDISKSFQYYLDTSATNIGYVISAMGLLGLVVFVVTGKKGEHFWMAAILLIPFVFYCVTLYMGQSVIFIPSQTPSDFTWNLFNTRYGVMMIPAAAISMGYLFGIIVKNISHKWYIVALPVALAFVTISLQTFRFAVAQEQIISLEDGRKGLSSAKIPDAQLWLKQNYDDGLVLMDDYSRTLSVIRSGIPMQKMIYIGNQKYWSESLVEPEKYATWIVMQKEDAVWRAIMHDPQKEGRLYANFQKTYTSPDILIFKRTTPLTSSK